jgi:hypothetical protein
MKQSEKEIQNHLEETNKDLKEARLRLKECKFALQIAEDNLITLKLTQEKLIEQLRVIDCEKVKFEKTANQVDIERFREALPNLLEKLK